MNIKLTKSQLTSFLWTLNEGIFTTVTPYERRITEDVLNEIKISLLQKCIVKKQQYSLTLRPFQLRALHFFLSSTLYNDSHAAVTGNMILGTIDRELSKPMYR